MAWTAPITWTANTTLTASQLNTHLRDNLLCLEPALASTVGSYFVTNITNSVSERVPASQYIATAQTTTSTSYTDLSTAGPSVTLETGEYALVLTRCYLENSTADNACLSSFQIDGNGSGTVTQAPTDGRAILMDGHVAANGCQFAQVDFVSQGLVAGSNTFTAKYRVSGGGTGTFSHRFIAVLPF